MRQREGIWGLLTSLPDPFGIAAPQFYRSIDAWASVSPPPPHAASSMHVDWTRMPPSLDPCAFLSSKENIKIKKEKSMNAVLKSLGLEEQGNGGKRAARAAAAAAAAAASSASQGEAAAAAAVADTPKDESMRAQLDKRGMHKRWQVESFVVVLRRLMELDPSRTWHVVDFGCGTGGLLLPLACLFPSCKFTGVEMKPAALAILRQRAAVAGLSNVETFVGMIEEYEQPFDVALAL